MTTITFDTYDFIQSLKESGIPEKQAKSIVEGIKKIDLGHVASKEDIVTLDSKISNLENKMLEMKISLIQWMISLLFLQSGLIIAVIKLLQ